jgi:RNA polymerase sigma-70 factor (ECF subfamily)
VDAFEELVRRHHRRLYRTLVAVTGRADEAEDDVQSAFLKAYENLARFRGQARFATWLTRIAINEGLERRRRRGRTAPLEGEAGEAEPLRPRSVEAWAEDAEKLYRRQELRELVERELMRLPVKYRLVVVLRDLEQLPGREVAAALGLGLATMKTRLLRGRLMLREALAPYFTAGRRPAP